MAEIAAIQKALNELNIGGWLFFDHHYRDPLAYRVLGMGTDIHVSRRWYYFIPAVGSPAALVHRIEPHVLGSLPGDRAMYSGWAEQHRELLALLKGTKKVAMQFSPLCAVPYVATVDAGTVDLIRGFGVEVVSSADLVQLFEAKLSPEAVESHLAAGKKVDAIRAQAFSRISEKTRARKRVTEFDIKKFILDRFAEEGLVTDHGPDIAVNRNSSNPHYDPREDSCAEIRIGDFVLIDMWAKLKRPGAIYYDITWSGYCGDSIPAEMHRIFEIVSGARDAAVNLVRERVAAQSTVRGFEVDDIARRFINERGHGADFFHRTGHSIGESVHGNGANIDNLESHDERVLIPWSCFSIEPGVYLKEFGIRSELNMIIDNTGAHVTGEVQQRLLSL